MGSLVVVGPGMTLGAHISLRCRSHIENADVVFSCCHPIMDQWIAGMNKDVRSLQPLYAEGKNRRETYSEMQRAMMQEIRNGRRVVAAFYGHPGVFAQVPHATIRQAREEGYSAHMEPGISAEDCLYADMGIDPGTVGCQHFEASQMMFYKRTIDNTAYLILWQIALAGDTSISKRQSSPQEKALLVDLLSKDFPLDHKVAVYECPTLIVDSPRIEWIQLQQLATVELTSVSTLVVPPARQLVANNEIVSKIRALNNS